LALNWVCFGFELALIGFELALFLPCPKPPNFAYYLVIKELTPFLLILKLGLFCIFYVVFLPFFPTKTLP
jgi:hypothetical protein